MTHFYSLPNTQKMSYHLTWRKKNTCLHLYETPTNSCLMHIYHPPTMSDLQWKRLASPSESLNKRLKLKSLLTNPSLVDTKPGNTIGLIKLIGSVCPERGPACQSNVDVSAVTNSGNGFSFPLEAGGRINLTVERVIGQNCAGCSCQSISEELSISSPFHNAAHLWSCQAWK